MRLTLIHPCVGRHPGDRRYVRSWQMEPLAPAVLAALTPADVEVRFYDDRLEAIPYDQPTDLVALSVETYTARRAYEIASEYRRRGVPVAMGGFHATLCPAEVGRHAEAVVVGEAEGLWPRLVDDLRHRRLEPLYRAPGRPSLAGVSPDRRIFRGKRYLPVTLVEAGRGCHFRCDFCAIQSYFDSTQTRRPVDLIVREIEATRDRARLYFFVDDNITSNLESAKDLYRALAPLGIRWVSQASINVAHDEELLDLLVRSGCQGLLIGFESLDPTTLRAMNKSFNTAHGGYPAALANLRRHHIRIYATFIFGYDHDTPASFDAALDFARENRFYIAAFNHLTPFPGTPLYARLAAAGRLRYDAWWLDPHYRYNDIPFFPAQLTPDELQRLCLEARARFYSLPSIARRFADPVNCSNDVLGRSYPFINLLLRREVRQRDHLPLGANGPGAALFPVDPAGAPAAVLAQGQGVRVRLARPDDDAAVRALLRANPLAGAVRLSLEREPSSRLAAGVEGELQQVIVAEVEGQVVSMGSRALRTACVNGRPTTLGYLGQLRVDRRHRGSRRILLSGYRELAALHADGRTPFYVTTIVQDNLRARRFLEAGIRGLPRYALREPFVTLALAPGRRRRHRPPPGVSVERGSPHAIAEVVACLQRHARRHQFAPWWTEQDLASEERTRGLAASDFWVARRAGSVVGTIALWDQRGFKQAVVRGYGVRLAALRPFVNAAARALGTPRLPAPGEALQSAFLSHLAIDDDDPSVLIALVDTLAASVPERALDSLLIGLAERHPLLAPLARAFPHRRYVSLLYAVHWPDGAPAVEALDQRVPHLEAAVL